MIQPILKYLRDNSWKSIYVTQDPTEYGRVKGALNDAGISSKTKCFTPMQGSNPSGFGTSVFDTSYDILVKQKNVHKAVSVIHKS